MSSDQGPVVQSIVSLMSSLRVISLTILVDSVYNILIFFAEKMWVAKATHIFSEKISAYCVSLDVNFNESLTKDIVSFEQLGPDTFLWWTGENYPRNIIRCFQLVTYLSEILTPIINIWKKKKKKKKNICANSVDPDQSASLFWVSCLPLRSPALFSYTPLGSWTDIFSL